MRKGGTGKGRGERGREENKRWKRKKCVKLQLPENIGLQIYQRQTTDTHLRSIPSCCQILSMIPMICSVSIS